jgi:hypothetical protein
VRRVKCGRRASGFTVLDLSMAVVVASIALAATAAAVATGAKVARVTAESRIAVRAARSMMERVRSTPFDQITTTYNATSKQISELGGADSAGTATTSVSSIDTGSTRWRCLRVAVRVRWTGVAGAGDKSFVTYVGDRLAGSSLSSSTTVPAETN